MELDWHGWLTLGVVVVCLGAMVREVAGPDLIMMAGLVTLAAAGVLDAGEAFQGFANPALAAVGALFVVSAGLRETGGVEMISRRLFGGASSERAGVLRLCAPVGIFSAFLNNAPIVAMMTPAVSSWAQRAGMAPSRFLIPLSYASILGSTTTVIGTSTILVVAGMVSDAGMQEFAFFELLPVGLPIFIVGLLYLTLVAPALLPSRQEPSEVVGENRREYTGSMIVGADCPLAGETVEGAGLRQLPGLFLVEIERNGRAITPVTPDERLEADDRLVFAGVVSTIVELQKIRGLRPLTEEETASDPRPAQRLVEAVISRSSPLRGRSIRAANFRTTYDAAVIAVHRNGERVPGKIGSIVLRAGDTLLLQTAPRFIRSHRNSPDFFLTSEVEESEGLRHEKTGVAFLILAAMVVSSAFGLIPIYVSSFLAAGALIGTRCINGTIARRSVVWPVLLVIGAALGIAAAMEKTGAAAAVATLITATAGSFGAFPTLVVVYVTTLLMAEMLHHNASVAIMFPVAVASAAQVGADPHAFVVAVAIAGCCAFASPVGYQTHLIVYGPGGYRFADFIKVGLPLDLVCAGTALMIIPRVWPL